ncbi:hypothetical protein BGZ60DRAFT_123587 [Tricladium varicosporioides]|nr:hypothetical protein BGZ60DRAFT_123587 [Hymenoscyphus varicosporioides]
MYVSHRFVTLYQKQCSVCFPPVFRTPEVSEVITMARTLLMSAASTRPTSQNSLNRFITHAFLKTSCSTILACSILRHTEAGSILLVCCLLAIQVQVQRSVVQSVAATVPETSIRTQPHSHNNTLSRNPKLKKLRLGLGYVRHQHAVCCISKPGSHPNSWRGRPQKATRLQSGWRHGGGRCNLQLR